VSRALLLRDLRFASRETPTPGPAPTQDRSPWASFHCFGALDAGNSKSSSRRRRPQTPRCTASTMQDDFRVTATCTVNLGLRYEYEGGLWTRRTACLSGSTLHSIPGCRRRSTPRSANAREMMAQSPEEDLQLHGRFLLHRGRQQAQDQGLKVRVHAASASPGASARDGRARGYGRFVTRQPRQLRARHAREIDLSPQPDTNALRPRTACRRRTGRPFPQG